MENVKREEINFTHVDCKGKSWIERVQDRVQWRERERGDFGIMG
jgi:hypothetical protein